MRRRIWGLIFVLAGLVFGLILPATSASAAGTAKISGRVLESGTGLPLVGVSISAVGPTNESSKTDASGSFVLDGLTPGRYLLVATLVGYENTESENFDLADGQNRQVTLAVQRLSGVNSNDETSIGSVANRVRYLGDRHRSIIGEAEHLSRRRRLTQAARYQHWRQWRKSCA